MSILAEFRQHTWPHKLHDFEQVIEKFNTTLVDLPVNVPEFLSIHDNFKVGILSILKFCMWSRSLTLRTHNQTGRGAQVALQAKELLAGAADTHISVH